MSPACMTEGWLLPTLLHNWTNVVKKCVNIHCEERLCEVGLLLLRNHCWGSKTMSTGSSGTIEQWNKVPWTNESKFKIFQSNKRVYMLWRVSERAATPCITPTVKYGGGSVMVWWAFANFKVGDLHQVKGKLNQTSRHSITQSHLERGLEIKG